MRTKTFYLARIKGEKSDMVQAFSAKKSAVELAKIYRPHSVFTQTLQLSIGPHGFGTIRPLTKQEMEES